MRYFIVAYNALKNGELVVGDTNGKSNGYINRAEFCASIAKAFDFEHVSIVNIVELKKVDFDEYNRQLDKPQVVKKAKPKARYPYFKPGQNEYTRN